MTFRSRTRGDALRFAARLPLAFIYRALGAEVFELLRRGLWQS